MHNKWNSANVDQVLLRKGEEHLLYRGPEGSVVRNDHLVMSDIGGASAPPGAGKRGAFLHPPGGQ